MKVIQEVLSAGLAALDDPRFATGPRIEFEAARQALREGTPAALRRAVAESCNTVESAMKVLLDSHSVARPARENAQDLFNALRDAGLVPREAEEVVLSAPRFGNRKGRHGAGPVPHDVTEEEAEAVVGAAANAATFLARRLP